MKPLDRLSEYLGAIEKRLRLLALTRGIAVTAGLALALTVLAVLVINQFAFSNPSVISARVFLFLGLAFAIAAALVIPVIRLNRRRAAREAEARHPQFEERLLTLTERLEATPSDPFLELLASDTLDVAQRAEPKTVARDSWIFGFSGAAVFSVAVLVWLGTTSGFMGYGTSLLWAGVPKGASSKPYYSIQVTPGNHTVRKRSDQVIAAHLMGFNAPKVRFFAKYASASQWEQAEMAVEPGGSGYQFLIAGVPETLEYYVEAGGVKSETYKLNVVDLPGVKKIRVTYHFPAWLGLQDAVEDPGGDLRAVEGTKAEVAVQTDKPLASGVLVLDDGSKLDLKPAAGGLLTATVPIQRDGVYHVAAMEGGDDVRLSEDYFIEAQKDKPPEVKITRPGRDFKVSPIEEVTITVDAKDDFGLKNVELHYSVNGGPEKTLSLLQGAGTKASTGSTVLALEDFKVEPGDVVSLYAVAKDARSTTNTDIYFIEAQPFERNYTQSQQAGGGGGGGDDDGDQQNQISQRQKEIIAATWNEIKGGGAKASNAENTAFLSNVQSKLRDQAKSLGDRMKARQLTEAGDSFKSFVKDMEQAVEAMGPAVDKLKSGKWQDALAPEQKALQYLMRAEATFRDIQVAFGNQRQGGGGGGGGAGGARDLEGLFDLELDTEKNQYESNRSQQSSNARQQQIDDAMQKLEALARRQQELADQAQRNPQTSQQRWQQEMLRREAEQLRQQLEQLTRDNQNEQLSRNGQQGQQQGQQSQQSGQSGQQRQTGQSQQAGQSGQQGGQPSQAGQSSQMQNGQQQQNGQPQQGNPQSAQQRAMQQQMNGGVRGADPRQLQQMLERLNQAMDDMRGAASSQQAGTPQGEAQARRAAERLKEIQQMAQSMHNQESNNQVESLVHQAEDLARRQQAFEGEMRRTFGQQSEGVTQQKANQLATEKEGEIQDLKRLEQGMQSAVRDLQNSQRKAATKLRETLGEMQQAELPRDMQRNADWIRRGIGQYGVMSEATITQGLNEVRDQLKQVQQMLGQGSKDGKDGQGDKIAEQTLGQVERLRQQLEQMSAQRGHQGQQQGGQRGQQGGQQKGGQQSGQQGGQQSQQSGQQGGGQQAGGNQQGGNQQGGNQQGGNQQGGNQQGGNQPGGQMQQGAVGPQQSGGGNTTWGPGGPRNGYYNGNPMGGPWLGGNYDPRVGPVRPEDFTNQYNQTLQSLRQLEQADRADPNMVRDLQNLIRDMQRLNPNTYANDPLLAERIQATLMGGVQQVEMELRRKVEESNGTGSVRSPGGDKVPQGWEGSVAEYFRKLSKTKQ